MPHIALQPVQGLDRSRWRSEIMVQVPKNTEMSKALLVSLEALNPRPLLYPELLRPAGSSHLGGRSALNHGVMQASRTRSQIIFCK